MKSSAFPLFHLHMYRTSPRRPRKPESGAGESSWSSRLGSRQRSLSCATAHLAGTCLFLVVPRLRGSQHRDMFLVLPSPMFHLFLALPHLMEKSGPVGQRALVLRDAFPLLCVKFCSHPLPRDVLLMLLGSCPLPFCPVKAHCHFASLTPPIRVSAA